MSLPNSSRSEPGLMPAASPILCYVTDRHSLPVAASSDICETLLCRIEAVAEAGVDWIQIREKDLSGKECASLTREALHRVAKSSRPGSPDSRILVNNRLDVALAEHAGGVHLGEDSLPVEDAKRLSKAFLRAQAEPRKFLTGVSCHSLEAAQSAASAGADYIFFGPIFATPSKASYGSPQGLKRLTEVSRAVDIPVLAIGGITLDNAAGCLAAGAAGIAATPASAAECFPGSEPGRT